MRAWQSSLPHPTQLSTFHFQLWPPLSLFESILMTFMLIYSITRAGKKKKLNILRPPPPRFFFFKSLMIVCQIPWSDTQTHIPPSPHAVKHIYTHMHVQESCHSTLTIPKARVNNYCGKSCQRCLINMFFCSISINIYVIVKLIKSCFMPFNLTWWLELL